MPGGPKKISEESLSAWIARLKRQPFPIICSWPIYSSKLIGLMREARGSFCLELEAAASKRSLLTVPFALFIAIKTP